MPLLVCSDALDTVKGKYSFGYIHPMCPLNQQAHHQLVILGNEGFVEKKGSRRMGQAAVMAAAVSRLLTLEQC